jgi:hypothetical protein
MKRVQDKGNIDKIKSRLREHQGLTYRKGGAWPSFLNDRTTSIS